MNDMNTRKRMITRFQDALRPFSWVYGTAATLRRKLYAEHVREPKRLPCPTISIGNMTTGGTGKTPMTIYLAAFLWKAGLAPLIVSRGYRGSASADGGIVSDGRDILMDAGRSGDEPLLMAERLPHVPVAVGRKRYAIAMEAIRRFSPAVVLLDDGFQHLLDYARPLGNNHLLPAGTLREPSTVLRQADIVVFTRSDKPGRPHSRHIQKLINDKPLFYACHIPIITHRISGNGIFKTADRPGLENLAGIFRKARKSGADIMLTSGKDYVKFRDRMPPDFPCDLVVLDAAISFKDQAERFEELILTNIQNRL